MPRQRIPSGGKWIGIREGEFSGNFYSSKNISLERSKGKITLGESFTGIFTETNDADLTTPIQFLQSNADATDEWWALGGKLFQTGDDNPEGTWVEHTAGSVAGSPPSSPLYDMIEFLDTLLVATSTNVDELTAGTWLTNWWSTATGSGGAGGSALSSGVPHRFAIHAGALLITDGRLINTWDGTTRTEPALTLPTEFEAQFILVASDVAYICCNAVGDIKEAEVFAWDRTTGDDYNSRYRVGDRIILAGFVVRGVPYIITKKGAIMRFTGQGFARVQQFPSFELGMDIADINPNGVLVEENRVRILVTFGASTGTGFGIDSLRILDGLWTFDAETNNLYHSGSPRDDSGNDFSQQELSAVGAVVGTQATQGRYLIGAKAFQVYTGTTEEGIFTSDEDGTIATQQGYIITPKISSNDVRAFWKQIFPRYRRQSASGDRIRVLYRTQESNTLPAYETITWVNATSFTGTNTDVAVNDFVEILAGANAGIIAKITAISGSGTLTFTITSDATLNAVTSTARARYLPFKDLGTVSSQATQTEVFRISEIGPWVQFLIMFLGNETSPALESFIIDFNDKPL